MRTTNRHPYALSQRLPGLVMAVVMAVQGTAMGWVGLNFSLNQDHIVESFCEQREAPVNHCQGSCHLEKQMAHSTPDGAESPVETRDFSFLMLLMNPIKKCGTRLAVPKSSHSRSFFEAAYWLREGHSGAVFVPPRA